MILLNLCTENVDKKYYQRKGSTALYK